MEKLSKYKFKRLYLNLKNEATKTKKAKTRTPSAPERKFSLLWAAIVPHLTLQPEFRFSALRRWRFDFAHEQTKTAIELEGGIWKQGRHLRPVGFSKDCEKYLEATLCGWTVFRLTPELINTKTVKSIAEFMTSKWGVEK